MHVILNAVKDLVSFVRVRRDSSPAAQNDRVHHFHREKILGKHGLDQSIVHIAITKKAVELGGALWSG